MNQTKRINQANPGPASVQRRPKRCMICRKMFSFEMYPEHAEGCSKAEQRKIEASRIQQKNARNSTVYKANVPLRKKQSEEKGLRENLEQSNRFRIKSLANPIKNGQAKSKSVLVKNKRSEMKEEMKLPEFQESKVELEIKQEKRQVLFRHQSISSIQSEHQHIPIERQPSSRGISQNRNHSRHSNLQVANTNERNAVRNPIYQSQEGRLDNQPQANPPSLIEPSPHRLPIPVQPQAGNYDIQSLINNSNQIIEFIRSINILGEDETMATMLSQLQQLNLIAEQIFQLNSIGHAFGSTMGNLFAARIHELQTVITNQIGIALIRGFNERLGSEYERIMQRSPELRTGFTQTEIEEIFPEKINLNSKECSICLEDMKPCEMIIQLQCYHHFHPGCIKEWLCSSRKCPMCRKVQQNTQ